MSSLADEAHGLCAHRGASVQRDFLGAPWLFPEENCCACGKGVVSLDTRLWNDCDPRWPTPKRGCPGFVAWEQASAFYIGQSHEIRSQSQGNPCIAYDDATSCSADSSCHWDKQAGGRLGTDKHDMHRCKLLEAVPDYAEGHRLEAARLSSSQDARCLDGSAPLYFLKRGTGNGVNRWYIHHEGGGWSVCLPAYLPACLVDLSCLLFVDDILLIYKSMLARSRCVGEEECGLRAKAAGETQQLTRNSPKIYTNLGSTEQFVDSGTLTAANGGYFSSDPTLNPMMYNWNMVLIKYCDGGSFAGNKRLPLKTPNGTTVLHHARSLPCAPRNYLL